MIYIARSLTALGSFHGSEVFMTRYTFAKWVQKTHNAIRYFLMRVTILVVFVSIACYVVNESDAAAMGMFYGVMVTLGLAFVAFVCRLLGAKNVRFGRWSKVTWRELQEPSSFYQRD